MNLLVTNDDGIDSVFLHELVRALLGAGHSAWLVAPRHEQSWVGAAKSRSRPVHSCAEDRGLGCPTWIVDGTPSDCVNIALSHLLPSRPDAVVSGINVGMNASLGFIIASGTVAGAWEGALHGLPAAALSQHLTEEAYESLKSADGRPGAALMGVLRASAARGAEITPRLLAATTPGSFIVHNLNFPQACSAATAVRRTVPARTFVPDLFTAQAGDGTHRLVFRHGEDVSPGHLPTDRAALEAGFISHTELDYTRLATA